MCSRLNVIQKNVWGFFFCSAPDVGLSSRANTVCQSPEKSYKTACPFEKLPSLCKVPYLAKPEMKLTSKSKLGLSTSKQCILKEMEALCLTLRTLCNSCQLMFLASFF